MISFTEQQTQYGDYTQNATAANLARAGKLANIEHRYLLQKYFNNEGSFQTTTVGAQTLATTGALLAGAITATLSTAWTYHTTTTTVTFSNGDIRQVKFIAGSTAMTWTGGLTAAATTVLAVGALQFYPAPPNFSKLKTVTINVGALKWTPTEVLTREEWDKLNVFPYYSDIPNNFFLYPGGDHGGQIGIFPIPASTGNIITYNYKFRIPDLSIADYSTGTVTVTKGSTAITGAGTTWTPTTNANQESRWIKIAESKGDNLWYQIENISAAGALTLYQPYQGINVSGGSYIIGQMPLLMEDFQDMLIWKPLIFYFSTIVPDPGKTAEFKELYDQKLKQLDEYAGTKTINVNLGRRPMNRNPNLYGQSFGA